jgi:tryptophan halogenase
MHVCILGGGTAGWMTAAALSKKFDRQSVKVTLIESDSIGTVGVGEATLPNIRFFNETLGINEAEFMRHTQATFKLGIEFVDWGNLGQRYIHPFGDFGESLHNIDFYQYWLKLKQTSPVGKLSDFAFGIVAAQQNKFCFPHEGKTKLQQSFGYAYQFDSGLYANFLSKFSQSRGVKRIEGTVVDTQLYADSGNVKAIQLKSGQQIEADFFVDCSGFKGVLIEQALESGYQDWSQWLPVNRAIAVPSENTGELSPYTRATAKESGWVWRIPLQHRTGNGHVYWNEFTSDEQAADTLLKSLDAPTLAEPKQLFFKTGRRNHFWKKNVVAIGLSAGFLEPLESTSIHLIQESITNLIELFPHTDTKINTNSTVNTFSNTLVINENDVEEYNSLMSLQYERVRDFLLLHYVATQRSDSEMWRYFKAMTLPDSLQEKIDAWTRRAYIQRYEFGAFLPPSWLAVLLGQNLLPEHFDPRVAKSSNDEIQKYATVMRNDLAQAVKHCKSHSDFLKAYGASSGASPLRAT